MNREELTVLLESGLFGDETQEVFIRLSQPSIAKSAVVGIASAAEGIDWDCDRFLIFPEEDLVSWNYLEQIHPGIREELEAERQHYENRPLRVIVAGSRDFGHTPEEKDTIRKEMARLSCPPYITPSKIEIISGCARGVDSTGEEIAEELGYAVKRFPADWEGLGKAAGHIRNRQMADYAAENDHKWRGMLLAFWDGKSRGTENMIKTAEKLGLQVRVVSTDMEDPSNNS